MGTGKIPMRMCTGCREMKPKRELIRIVKTPDGEIKPTLQEDSTAEERIYADRSNALKKQEDPAHCSARSVKACRTVCTKQSKRSLTGLRNKLLALLGFAAKSGNLSYGMAKARESLAKRKAKLAVSAADVSEKSRKEIGFFCEKHRVKLLVLEGVDISAVSDAVGRRCGILTINDSGFADAFLKAYVEGGKANDE